MTDRGGHVDPISEEFTSYEEAAEFRDAHDMTDYLDAFRTVAEKLGSADGTMRSR